MTDYYEEDSWLEMAYEDRFFVDTDVDEREWKDVLYDEEEEDGQEEVQEGGNT